MELHSTKLRLHLDDQLGWQIPRWIKASRLPGLVLAIHRQVRRRCRRLFLGLRSHNCGVVSSCCDDVELDFCLVNMVSSREHNPADGELHRKSTRIRPTHKQTRNKLPRIRDRTRDTVTSRRAHVELVLSDRNGGLPPESKRWPFTSGTELSPFTAYGSRMHW